MLEQEKKLILEYLERLYPDAVCELKFNNGYQLVTSVILSAQCTDKRVNQTTPALFNKYPSFFDLATAKQSDVEELIKPCGFYHNKAKNIIACSKAVVEKYNGKLPNTVQEMMTLPGVGMKTAKVVCSNLYGSDVIAVDTHVKRVSNRLGLVKEDNPDKISEKLEKIFAGNISGVHHRFVLFGRYTCKSQSPKCSECELKGICKYYKKV